MTDTRTRVLIADDHPMFREGLRKLLEADPHFTVIGEASGGHEAVTKAMELRPDVLLLDLRMKNGTGLDALERLAAEGHTCKVLLLTAGIEADEVTRAIQLGARGVVLKESATDLLYKAIRRVLAGEYWLGRDTVADLLDALRQAASPAAAQDTRPLLTKRELQIVRAIAQGASNKDVAAQLNVSEQTVKNHLSNVFDKLGVSSRLELALYAVSHKLVEEPHSSRS